MSLTQILNNFEWWQALIIVFLIIVTPLVKAVAVVILGKYVNPDLAKIALPLIFPQKWKKHQERK